MTDHRDIFLSQSDARLLTECQVHTHRPSGPGGRKRDTTDSAVRMTHLPTGLSVACSDSRSQIENRRRALKSLRKAIALLVREGPPAHMSLALRNALADPAWPRISRKSPEYLIASAEVLDRLATEQGRVSDVARVLGVSTASLVKFLSLDVDLWVAANRIRDAFGHKPLR